MDGSNIMYKYKNILSINQKNQNGSCEKFQPVYNYFVEDYYYYNISNGIIKDYKIQIYPIIVTSNTFFTNLNDWYNYILPYILDLKNRNIINNDDYINFIKNI